MSAVGCLSPFKRRPLRSCVCFIYHSPCVFHFPSFLFLLLSSSPLQSVDVTFVFLCVASEPTFLFRSILFSSLLFCSALSPSFNHSKGSYKPDQRRVRKNAQDTVHREKRMRDLILLDPGWCMRYCLVSIHCDSGE